MTTQISTEIQIDRLIGYAGNPPRNDGAVDRMCGSIREFGFKFPCLVRSEGELIDGHLRLKAARTLGLTGIPVILCDEWAPAQVKAFRIAQVADRFTWYGKPGQNSTIRDSASPKFIMGGTGEEKFDHPTQKPVELMRKPILNHTRPGELVYEPFLGSGTTLVAAEVPGRVCYGLELDPKYADVVGERWQSLTGEKATLESDGRTFDAVRQDRLRMAA